MVRIPNLCNDALDTISRFLLDKENSDSEFPMIVDLKCPTPNGFPIFGEENSTTIFFLFPKLVFPNFSFLVRTSKTSFLASSPLSRLKRAD